MRWQGVARSGATETATVSAVAGAGETTPRMVARPPLSPIAAGSATRVTIGVVDIRRARTFIRKLLVPSVCQLRLGFSFWRCLPSIRHPSRASKRSLAVPTMSMCWTFSTPDSCAWCTSTAYHVSGSRVLAASEVDETGTKVCADWP